VNHFGWPIQAQLGQLMPFFTALVLSVYANYTIDRGRRRTYELRSDLEKQKEKSENLLFNVLPREVALRLRGNETVADAFSEVSVIFIDIVGFSQMSRRLSPTHLVDVLNAFFSVAEECAVTAGVEKVKTIGDAFLAVAGATLRSDNCAVCAVNFAAQVIDCLASVTKSTGEDLQVRVGIHTGAVVGGVIGHSRKAYDYWGDTMNIASRIQNSAEPNSIFVSETTYHRARQKVAFGPAELKILKGVGETKVYRAFVGKVAP
jgi:class 3 adenylate cyclase